MKKVTLLLSLACLNVFSSEKAPKIEKFEGMDIAGNPCSVEILKKKGKWE